jgi:hypothetical protein
MVLKEPQDGIGPVLTARYGRVARAALGLDLGHLDFGFGQLQPVGGIQLGCGDLLARQLAGGNWIHAFDAMGHVAIGNALHLEHVQAAELGDLLEGKRGVVDQPYSSRFRH